MTQQWAATTYARNAAFVPALGEAVVALLAPRAGERILDLGCGDGVLTERLAGAGAAVVGVDTSAELLAAALGRGIDARRIDGRNLRFAAEFDAVFSNAALHWMDDPDAVLAGVYRALKPGGRFVGEFGGHANVAAICTAVLAALRADGTAVPTRLPWYFPTAAEYGRRLRERGFTVDELATIPRPTPLPTGMRAWLETFAGAFLGDVEPERRAVIFDDAVSLLAPSLRDAAGNWSADYVRLRFAAHV